MSKMNCLRIVNLNYNNNAIKIEDETFELDGSSTLLSLQNGGGKSVLVQMMTAPFVRKRYRDTKERPFQSYFTTNQPTHILVEWILDGGAGYVLTGLMIRKQQVIENEDDNEDLQMHSFIYEYREQNEYDIRHIPVIENDGKQRKLLSYQAVLKIYDKIKQEKSIQFQKYDMNQAAQRRQYFSRLKQYQIDHSEWETIIKKINLKESGLSELFQDAKDEAGLIDKWFITAVESKLNKEENRVREFAKILYKYFTQYKENESKMERKATIHAFQDDGKEVGDKTDVYLASVETQKRYERKIGSLSVQLDEIKEAVTREEKLSREKMFSLEEGLKHIQYEQYSYDAYQKIDEKEVLGKRQLELDQVIAQYEEEQRKIARNRNILECARLLEEYRESSREVQRLENRLQLLKQDEKNTIPERNNIGFTLRLHYEVEQESHEEKLSDTRMNQRVRQEDKEKQNEQKKKLEQELQEQNQKLGSIQEKLKSYNKEEKRFCDKYHTELTRNILGIYEEGTLELLQRTYEKEFETLQSDLGIQKRKKVELEDSISALSRNIEDEQEKRGNLTVNLKYEEENLAKQDEELVIRQEILRHIGFGEERQFETDNILKAFQDKIAHLKEGKRQSERQLDNLQTEYRNIESGKVLELPKMLADLLHGLDIQYVFGMEYLRRNAFAKEKKQQLLKSNPFLPYSILMSQRELDKLKETEFEFYTSTPIPIVVRESLFKNVSGSEKGILQAGPHYFFASFNHGLLDEIALKQLLEKKKDEIQSEQEKLDRRKEEIAFYEEKQNCINFQKVTKENYDATKKRQEELKSEIQQLEELVANLRQEKEKSQKTIKELDVMIETGTKKADNCSIRNQEFEMLLKSYEDYLETRREQVHISKKIAEGKDSIIVLERKLDQIEEAIQNYSEEAVQEESKIKKIKEKLVCYKSYIAGTIVEKDIEDLEARYQAITDKMGADLNELELSLRRERSRFEKSQNILVQKQNEYKLIENEFNDILSNTFREGELKDKEDCVIKKIKNKTLEKQSNHTQIAVLETQIEGIMKQLKQYLDQDELLPKEKIVDIEFKKRERLIKADYEDERKHCEKLSKRISSYEANISNLAEFEDFKSNEEDNLFEELKTYEVSKLEELSDKQLDKFRGEMVRDYRKAKEIVADTCNILRKKLEEMRHKSMYEEEFFHKQVENMYLLLEDPVLLKEQLAVTLDSYKALLEKLEYDLALVAKEREKIMEVLFDYIADVHKELGKIDRNSTITVRSRTIKMLRLKLLDWQENEGVFSLRLKDFMEELTNRVMERLEQNENIEELLGAAITTRNLYDSIIGFGSIGIKLYKIEADREYPITWKEVARNSGGEGFLSAFVVLSSLLSYMRLDDTDLFMDREEGKVIVMDNPFAQTNASHLLKPLMDVAKKNNTQLICLTGLGGESIYNRFDNIYVLNLVSSGLRKDVSYVKGEHVKGEDDENVKSVLGARIEVEEMEQMELEF